MKTNLAIIILPLENLNQQITTNMILPQLEKYDFEQNLIERYKDTIPDIPEEEHWFNPIGKYGFYMLLGDSYEEGDIYLESTDIAVPNSITNYCLELFTLFSFNDSWKIYKRFPHAIITPNGDWIELITFKQMQQLGGIGTDNLDWLKEAYSTLIDIIKHALLVLENYQNYSAVRIAYVA